MSPTTIIISKIIALVGVFGLVLYLPRLITSLVRPVYCSPAFMLLTALLVTMVAQYYILI